MPEDLTGEAVAALRIAAERLGVDPLRLARFLGRGRLAEILEVTCHHGLAVDDPRRFSLAEEYLKFLDVEIELHNEERPSATRNGR